ncbi:MAG: DUF1015 domain-containing protein [Clostridia bacterium]|nr:DUF1015 domain-containing protein [Clostridia bacterium]
MKKFENKVGIFVPELIFPNENIDLGRFAVVACDQYTSQPSYWEETERIVGDKPSALRMMLPEMYLDKPDEAERIAAINAAMDRYVEDGTLENKGQGFVLVRRSVAGNVRLGLVVALDLECYDFRKGSTTLIRATEGTIVERIPPRLRIRENAPLEMPHIIVLIDDPEKTVIEPLYDCVLKNDGKKLYDFELMQDGGHIEGWFIGCEDCIKKTIGAVEALADEGKFRAQYGDKATMVFAMGDGNHSFATAKANWEKVKETLPESEWEDHPARYALVELENVHDDGIIFEPIHRVLFNVDTKKTVEYLTESLKSDNGGCTLELYNALDEANAKMAQLNENGEHLLPVCFDDKYGFFRVSAPASQLEVGTLQHALDKLLKDMPGVVIDYIHGADVVYELGMKENNMGFLLPPMHKSALFRTVVFDGALPRKTFSMGEANEKRYYLECKRIK